MFRELDIDDNGNLTNLQFKEAIRNLGIGLTSREIDVLIKYCHPDDENMINWKNFIFKFKENTGEQQILDRTRQRLHHIKDQIYLF